MILPGNTCGDLEESRPLGLIERDAFSFPSMYIAIWRLAIDRCDRLDLLGLSAGKKLMVKQQRQRSRGKLHGRAHFVTHQAYHRGEMMA